MKDFEVIVVDDGSTDGTHQLLEEYRIVTPLHFRFFSQENGGPARARNAAISVLQTPLCLLIGDDILASPSLVSRHLELHRLRPELEVAALGLTRWSDAEQTVTTFMRWLDTSGIQFAYEDLLRGGVPDWRYFYTSNLSLKTQILKDNPFNESFTKAAAEDLELGYRLGQEIGLEVVFISDALAYHLHPTGFRQACRRNFIVGKSMRLFHELWPGAAKAREGSVLKRSVLSFMLHNPWLIPPVAALADLVTNVWCPNIFMRGTLSYYFNLGYRDASATSQKR